MSVIIEEWSKKKKKKVYLCVFQSDRNVAIVEMWGEEVEDEEEKQKRQEEVDTCRRCKYLAERRQVHRHHLPHPWGV